MDKATEWHITLQSLPNFLGSSRDRQKDLSNIPRDFKTESRLLLRHPPQSMEQLIDDIVQKMEMATDASPSTSHPTQDPDSKETIAETQSKQETLLTAQNSSAETATVDFESQSAQCQGQTSTVVDSPLPTQAGVALANNAHAASAPTTAPTAGEVKPVPAARYLTYRREVFNGDHDIPVFGWFLTSPDGQTTWMYIT